MALITCPECGREISDKAVACPGCGCPVEEILNARTKELKFRFTDVNRNTLNIENGILYLYKGSHLMAHGDLKDAIILYYCKKNTFGAGQLSITFPQLKGAMIFSFRGKDCDLFENLYLDISKICRHERQVSIMKAVNYRTEEQKINEQERKEEFWSSVQTLSNLTINSKTPHCPKCRSTQITYGGNRISLGRAVVGGAVAGPAGATLGGLTGKKGYAVCLNCGKRWKI